MVCITAKLCRFVYKEVRGSVRWLSLSKPFTHHWNNRLYMQLHQNKILFEFILTFHRLLRQAQCPKKLVIILAS